MFFYIKLNECRSIYIVLSTAKRLHGYHVNLMPNGKEKLKGCSVR